jgi:RimJ/RimL family protein N-acetyltransferase
LSGAVDADRLLRGKRIWLRPAEDADRPAVHALWNEPEIRRFLFDDRVLSDADVAGHLEASREAFAAQGCGIWIGAGHAEEAPRVFAGFLHSGEGPPNLVFGLAPALWGQGLAAEASALVLGHAFGTLGLAEVRADVDEPNQASVRLLERLGFTWERRGLVAGRPLLYYRLSRERWDSLDPKPG